LCVFVQHKLNDAWKRQASSALNMWTELEKTLQQEHHRLAASSRQPVAQPWVDVVLWLSWPRLDLAVSKGLNHLLKAPFCVHPSTGRVSVPINIAADFHFDQAPTIDELLAEPAELDETRSRLYPYLHHFRRHFLAPLQSDRHDFVSLEF